ncbi:Tex family protein [Ligilactobacillus ceti]|uniref:Transcription accessory protein n=1 Tax=Ligilactobacillus ceti DSM 22408 TaxID=1122146 RepID=A0A0R2KQ88_9LACO|nr:Tex family protein [Ligilactobacillus ceti]KRN89052.1 transcription accessory protein [Ligilactobacillus ceti DSM 22408]
MEEKYVKQMAKTPYTKEQIVTVLDLLSSGNTVPFIARYRKEQTKSLDEVQIRDIQATYQAIEKLETRKESILKQIKEQGKLTHNLKNAIVKAADLQTVEDLYLPYKQKRQTKAQIAKDAGLTPLANAILSLKDNLEVQKYLNPEKKIKTEEDALNGAHEILVEAIAEDLKNRQYVRKKFEQTALLVSDVKDEQIDEKGIYRDYYEFTQSAKTIKNYRILAINRGEKAGVLKVKLTIDDDVVMRYFHSRYAMQAQGQNEKLLVAAYQDSYRRFIRPAIERELRKSLTQQAEEQAIKVFGENLYNLLMQAPLKERVVLGLDPAYRTGCKLAVVDKTGKFLTKTVIYPHEKAKGAKVDPKLRQAAKNTLLRLIAEYQVDMIAIGNGTASRESEQFVAEVLHDVQRPVYYVIVNEAGASIYSGSELARQEFPDLQIEERSAISIARRLQDPLAELIKIDPKSIGVGQYQYDLPAKDLTTELDHVIETSVNQVGVDLNTASPQLLEHISGLNKTIAQNIVGYRNENGKFTERKKLKAVPRLGPKAYEQAAGFLRIVAGGNPLDNTDIHPESYPVAQKLLSLINLTVDDLGTPELIERLTPLTAQEIAQQLQVGIPTIQDIKESLLKPGRDQRDQMPAPLLRSDVLRLEDLKPGLKLQGTVRNVVDFGAFVDIGVKQDGLVHISQISQRFLKHPSEVVAIGDIVDVWVLEVDEKRGRIQLTMVPTKS